MVTGWYVVQPPYLSNIWSGLVSDICRRSIPLRNHFDRLIGPPCTALFCMMHLITHLSNSKAQRKSWNCSWKTVAIVKDQDQAQRGMSSRYWDLWFAIKCFLFAKVSHWCSHCRVLHLQSWFLPIWSHRPDHNFVEPYRSADAVGSDSFYRAYPRYGWNSFCCK